jgi:hypothetical protein
MTFQEQQLLEKLESLEQKLDRLLFLLEKTAVQADRMDEHVSFVNSVYDRVRSVAPISLPKMIGSPSADELATNST